LPGYYRRAHTAKVPSTGAGPNAPAVRTPRLAGAAAQAAVPGAIWLLSRCCYCQATRGPEMIPLLLQRAVIVASEHAARVLRPTARISPVPGLERKAANGDFAVFSRLLSRMRRESFVAERRVATMGRPATVHVVNPKASEGNGGALKPRACSLMPC
jgi:hypothetical protein